MKINFIILALHSFVLSSCQGTTKSDQVSTSDVKNNVELITENKGFKPIKSAQVFRYRINNADSKQFGFLSVQEDQSIGVRSVVLYGDFVFVSDPLHGNIKKIDLKDGKITSVSQQLDVNNSLRALTVFNNILYVLTDDANIFLLDFTLNKTEELFVPKYKWVKDVFKQTENELILFRPIEDVTQQADKSMKVKLVKIDRANTIKKDSLVWSYDEYNKSAYAATNIRGQQYNYLSEGGKHFVVNEYGKFELKEKLPSTHKYYDSKNIDFSVDKLVYYNVTPDEVILTVYEY